MDKCIYKYPEKNPYYFYNIFLRNNSAGKSTIIKIFCGEIKPNTGQVWRHQNMRVAYIAQHAFFHLEKHLDKTPNEYIQWRYSSGEDREKVDENDNKIDLNQERVFKNEDGTIEKSN